MQMILPHPAAGEQLAPRSPGPDGFLFYYKLQGSGKERS